MMTTIAVLGSLHLDIMVYAPDRPRKGETLRGTAWGLKCGGKGGNQAVSAARYGAQTYMIGRVGKDDFGDKLLANLRAAGVDTTYVEVDATAGSGMSVATVDSTGDYGAVIVSGVNLNIGMDDLERARALLPACDVLVLQYEVPLAAVAAAARWARAMGVRVILNAAPAYPPPDGLLDAVDVLVVNEVEAEMLSGVVITSQEEARRAAEKLREQVRTVIITLGGNGSVVADDTAITHIPAYPVTVVSTHGAGDAFVGALAVQLGADAPLLDAVRFASAAAALVVAQADDVSASAAHALMRTARAENRQD